AEDGIRDKLVTGVQTCALPIWIIQPSQAGLRRELLCAIRRRQKYAVFRNAEAEISEQRRTEHIVQSADAILVASISDSFAAESRSEERRVGKECRSRRSTEQCR